MLLRRFTAEDEALLFDLDSDPEVMRYINGGVPTSLERIRERVLPLALEDYEGDARWGMWAALLKPANEFIGWFHLWPPEGWPYDAEVGYRLRREFWAQGFATEGTRALIDKAFNEYGLQSVCARTLRENAGSRRVMEKAGLHFVQDFEERRFHNAPAVLYLITKS
jgi:RimJ/RimL family protein N-acetyltransferase